MSKKLAINIDKKSGLPIYLQVKEHIKTLILNKVIKPGYRLPTERDLAQELNVSRNTASMAYKELENEELITSEIGKGTFVIAYARKNKTEEKSTKDWLNKIIQHSVEEALASGYSLNDFMESTKKYISERKKLLKKLKMIFIECNIEQIVYFSAHMRLDNRIKIVPLLLNDLKENFIDKKKEIRDAHIIVTSFYHLKEIRNLIGDMQKEILAINLEPEINTIIKIARIPKNKVVSIIATSHRFIDEIIQDFKNLGFVFKKLLTSFSKSDQELIKMLRHSDVIIVSPTRKQEISILLKQNKLKKDIIEFVYEPDKSSINTLNAVLMEINSSF